MRGLRAAAAFAVLLGTYLLGSVYLGTSAVRDVPYYALLSTARIAGVYLIALAVGLGFEDDGQVRELSRKITDAYVGKGHLAGEMAVGPLDRFFPEIGQFAMFRDNGSFETVRKFDSSSTSYIA